MKQHNSIISLIVGTIVLTVIFGTIYAVGQQILRLSANYPQIQIAQDSALQLENGAVPAVIVSASTVNIADSLAPFSIIYDSNLNPLASSAILNGKVPMLPKGVFENAKARGENRITWQPQAGVRIAAVITYYEKGGVSGYVASGRSLREVEKLEDWVFDLAAWGWFISFAFFAIIIVLKKKLYPTQ